MERHANLLRRDAKAPFCLDPLPQWRYEHIFKKALKPFLSEEKVLMAKGLDILTAHHACSHDFLMTVDALIVQPQPSRADVLQVCARLLACCRRFLKLTRAEQVLEAMREVLMRRYPGAGGTVPAFQWEKGAADLFFRKVEKAGIDRRPMDETLFVPLDDVYDDCARRVQLGLWIMASPWRAAVIDHWIFESGYTFFHHTLPRHIAGSQGLITLLPECLRRFK